MRKIIVCQGLPASGKSTWAKEQVSKKPHSTIRINKDDLREMANEGVWGKHNEKVILDIRDAAVISAITNGFNTIIIDDTNLHPKHLIRMQEIAKSVKTPIKVEEKFFEVTPEEAIKRDLKRCKSVGAEVIWKMYYQYLAKDPKFLPQGPPIVKYDSNLPDCIICDLDGTLALFKFTDGSSTRSPFDASQCDKTDVINKPILEILEAFHEKGVAIILLSGRSGEYEKPTKRFLKNGNIPYKALYMRDSSDQRSDKIIKKELWEKHIKGKYNVKFVLDDRNQVVDLWRNDLGFTTLQVANGNF